MSIQSHRGSRKFHIGEYTSISSSRTPVSTIIARHVISRGIKRYRIGNLTSVVFPPGAVTASLAVSESFDEYIAGIYPIGDSSLTGGYGFNTAWVISDTINTFISESWDEYLSGQTASFSSGSGWLSSSLWTIS